MAKDIKAIFVINIVCAIIGLVVLCYSIATKNSLSSVVSLVQLSSGVSNALYIWASRKK